MGLGVERGRWVLVLREGDGLGVERGRWVLVLREGDGSWC